MTTQCSSLSNSLRLVVRVWRLRHAATHHCAYTVHLPCGTLNSFSVVLRSTAANQRVHVDPAGIISDHSFRVCRRSIRHISLQHPRASSPPVVLLVRSVFLLYIQPGNCPRKF